MMSSKDDYCSGVADLGNELLRCIQGCGGTSQGCKFGAIGHLYLFSIIARSVDAAVDQNGDQNEEEAALMIR